MLLCTAFVLAFTNQIVTKPLFLKMPLPRSQVVDSFEPEESISQESDITREVNGFRENQTARNRTTRSIHPCVSGIVREYDRCRKSWVMKVQCERAHPACNHVIPKHRRPKCQTVYGFRYSTFVTKCPSLPIDCKCAS